MNIINNCEMIDSMGIPFRSSIVKKVVSGDDTLFWEDVWCDLGCRLMDSFPRLYALESSKKCKISDRWKLIDGKWGGTWEWRSILRGRTATDFNKLLNIIGQLTLSTGKHDCWRWNLEPSGSLSVWILTKLVQDKLLFGARLDLQFMWNSWVPKKIGICVWRALINRRPTRSKLRSRGVISGSQKCLLCNIEEETMDHLINHCPKVIPIWRRLLAWWHIVVSPTFSVFDVAAGKVSISGNKTLDKILQGVFMVLIWSVWKWRNRLLHTSDEAAAMLLEDQFSGIQRMSLHWIKARCNNQLIDRSNWSLEPHKLVPS